MAIRCWCFALILPLFTYASADLHSKATVINNPADQLVAVLNGNRTTANKGTTLTDNPGLACIALEYIKAYGGNCRDVGGPKAKKPEASAIAEKFAPACGVSASTLTPITGRLLGCQTKYVSPSEAFSKILMKNNKSLEILYDKNHTQVGAAVSGSDGGSPYFWCVMFSSGKLNSSFVFDGGVAKVAGTGCYSGASAECSRAFHLSSPLLVWNVVLGASVLFVFVFGV